MTSRKEKSLADRIREQPARNGVAKPSANGSAPSKSVAPPPKPTKPLPLLPVPPYKPFPVEALPPVVRQYVIEGALALGCDVAYVAMPALAIAAGLIGYTRTLVLKSTWSAVCVLWMLVVAESGSLKTPSFRLSEYWLFRLQKRLDLEYKRLVKEYEAAVELWAEAKKAAGKGEGDDPGDEPKPPVRRTVFTSDATIEMLAELFDDNPRGLLVCCDELAGWMGSFSRYKGKAGGTDLPRYLSMHSGGGFFYHRKTGDRRRICVPHAALSIAGGIQPGVLAKHLAGEFIEAGLASRLLMAMPPRPPKQWTELEIDPVTQQRFSDLLDAIFALQFGKDRAGEDVPQAIRLSPEAKAVWVRWYNRWGQEQAKVEGELAASFSKLEETAARVALVHHVCTQAASGRNDLEPLSAASMEAGVLLTQWLAYESERVYRILAEDDTQRDHRRLLEFIIRRGGRVTERDLQRSNSRRFPDANVAEGALASLVDAGFGKWATPAEGKRTPVFELHENYVRQPDTSDKPDKRSGDGVPPPSDLSDKPPAPDSAPPEIQGENAPLSGLSDVSGCRTGPGDACEGPEDPEPGKTVCRTPSDNGDGIDPAIRQSIQDDLDRINAALADSAEE